MVSYSFRRPKTSSGLPTTNNDSTIICSTATASSYHLPTRRSTQDFLSRPSFSGSIVETTVAPPTGGLLQLKRSRTRDREDGEGQRIRFRKGVDDVRCAAAAMVRKALQGSRDMRPIDRLTPINPVDMFDSGTSSPSDIPARSRERDRSRDMTRPVTEHRTLPETSFSRWRASFRHTRRNAVSAHSGKSRAYGLANEHRGTTRYENMVPNSMAAVALSPTSSLPPPGSAARAAAAEHNKCQQERLSRADTVMTKKSYTCVDELMEDDEAAACLVNLSNYMDIDEKLFGKCSTGIFSPATSANSSRRPREITTSRTLISDPNIP
jgi:hypothetical protein